MLKLFARNESGHFALITALGLSAMITAVAVAVDIAGMSSQKQTLQSAVDSATLTAAVTGTSLGDAKQTVKESIKANMAGLPFTSDVQEIEGHLRVTATTTYTPMLAGIFGKQASDISVMAEVPVGGVVPLEIAFALDTTDSMSGMDDASDPASVTKIAALQTAAKGMITSLEAKAGGDLRAAVVPFSNYVNVGTSPSIRSQGWLDITGAEGTSTSLKCEEKTLAREELCTYNPISYFDDFGVETITNQRSCPDAAYDITPLATCVSTTNVKTWHGCVGSRVGELGLQTEADSMSQITGVTNTCSNPITGLTDNMDTVRASIDALTTEHKTYIPAGLVWAWRVLNENAPFPNVTSKPRTLRAVVLMTDGNISMYQNVNSYGHSNANFSKEWDSDQVDVAYTRMGELCSRIKADGMQLYTIGFALDPADTRTKTALSLCASSPGFSYEPQNAVQLEGAFDAIGASLSEIRLAR